MESEDTQWISMCSVIRAQKTIFLNVVEEKEKNEWYRRDKKERRSKDVYKEMKFVQGNINNGKTNEIKRANTQSMKFDLKVIIYLDWVYIENITTLVHIEKIEIYANIKKRCKHNLCLLHFYLFFNVWCYIWCIWKSLWFHLINHLIFLLYL